MNIDPLIAALNGGEDYELLFTVPIDMHDKVGAMEGVAIIGHIVDEISGAMLVTPQGTEVKLTAQGWNAIKLEDEE